MEYKVVYKNNFDSNVGSFLLKQKNYSVFQSLEIFKVFKSVKNYKPLFLVVEDKNNKILGSLLAIIQKEYGGFFTSRSIVMGGPIIEDNNIEVLSILLRKYNEIVGNKAIYTQFRNLREFSPIENEIFRSNGFDYVPHLDIIHDLTRPIDKQFMALHKGRRKNIRRAEKANVIFREIKSENEFEESYKLVKETYKRVKLPMPDESLFLESYRMLSVNGIFKVFIAIFKEEIIGTRMVLCYDDLIYDWFAGANKHFMDKYPNDFLPWKVMEWGSENGYRFFDFGGAGKPDVPYGVRDHKLKFGGDLVEYGRFQNIHYPLLYKSIAYLFGLYRKITK